MNIVQTLRGASAVVIAILFAGIGVLHFSKPEPFVAIVPAFLPEPLLLVWISGGVEIMGGLGFLIPQLRKYCGYVLLLLLVAVFPANINMAVNHIDFNGAVPTYALWLRLPLQFVFMAWIWWTIRSPKKLARDS